MRELTIGGRRIELWQGDITKFQGDAIGNAANEGLLGGGGVDGAIHAAGGPAIMEECRRIGGCPTGEARITTGGRLPARYVIHAVGPVYLDGNHGEPELLASAYRSTLALGEEHGVETLGLPAISAGVYGYPVDEVARIALKTAADHSLAGEGSLKAVTFVLFSASTMAVFEEALEKLARQM